MGFNTNLIIGTILISLVFVAMSAVLVDVAINYNVTIDSDLQDTFDKYEETQSNFEDTQDIIQGGDINEDGFDQAIYKNVIVAGKQVQQQGNIFVGFLQEIGRFIPIQAIIISMLGSIVFILVLMGFLKMITKQKP